MGGEKKKLGFFNIFSLGVGGAIGSGIFVMMGFGIAYTGRSIILAVSIGCIYMLMAYLYQPIMASMFVLPGGDYDMKAMLMGPTMTGFSALANVINGLGMASYGLAFASYFVTVFPALSPYTNLIAAIVLIAVFALSVKGTKALATFTSIVTVILLLSIAMFVVKGLPQVQPGFFSNSDGMFMMGGFKGFIAAISIMSFACQGTTMAPISVMPVTKKPRRTIPLGILVITVTVGAVYALMSVVAAGVLPVPEVMGQNLSVVAQTVFSPALFRVFILGAACCAILSSLGSGLSMFRYPMLALAEDGWLPPFFKKTDKNGYPYAIMGLFLAFAIVPLFTSVSVDTLISIIMIPVMLLNAYINIKMVKLPKDYPEQWKNATLHMPTPVFTVLCLIGSVSALIVAYNLFMMLSKMSMIFCVVALVVIMVVAKLELHFGIVKEADLIKRREDIAAAAVAATEAEVDE